MHWSVVNQIATLPWSDWHWQFQLNRPVAGVQLTDQRQRAALPWQVLAIEPQPGHACQIDDWFARGSDLMVRYAQSECDSFAFQLDFRALPSHDLPPEQIGFDLWLSVQTLLLDSHPTLDVTHHLSDVRWTMLDEHGQNSPGAVAIVAGQGAQDWLAVMIHPSDQPQAQWLEGSGVPRLRMFGGFMEKGVIRRGRLRMLLGRQELDRAQLVEAYHQFAEAPLPLTT